MKKKIVYIFLVLCTFAFVIFFVLKNGITISSVQFDFLKLEQLYIKLDKKLILRAKKITLNKQQPISEDFTNDRFVSKEILNIIKQLEYLYTFVEEIDIQSLNIKNNNIRILFKDDEFFVDNDALFLKLILEHKVNQIDAVIDKLLLKEYQLGINGKLSINTKSEFYHFVGNAVSDSLNFNLTLSYKNKGLAYKFENLTLTNLPQLHTRLEKKITLPQELRLWLVDNIQAQSYHLDFLQGFVDFSAKKYYFNDISAKGFADKVQIFLDKKSIPVVIPYLELNLQKQKLEFSFKQASYNKTDLSASEVYLYDILNLEKAGIFLRIKSNNAIFDEQLRDTLKTYHLNIPFYQQSGRVQTDLKLKINFNKKNSIFYEGLFFVENSQLSFANFDVSKALIQLTQNSLHIENASIKNAFLEADFAADFNLATKKAELNAQIARLHFGDDVFDMRNKMLRARLDYNQDIILEVPEFALTLNFTDGLEARADNVNAFVAYLPRLKQFGVLGADSLAYKSLNFDDFIFDIKNLRFENGFFVNGKPYQKDSFVVTKNKGIINIHSLSDTVNVVLNEQKKEIKLKNINYRYKQDKNVNAFDIRSNTQNITLDATNVALLLVDFNKTLAFDKLQTTLEGSVLNAQATRGVANLNLHYSPDNLYFTAKNIDDSFLNEFLEKKAVQEGVFDLNISGSSLEYFSGELRVKNTYVKDLKGANQLISFIDTVPSLLLFKSPTFNEKGLHFHSGKVVFNRKKDLFRFDAINFNGDSVDIFGLGSANLRLNELDLDLELKTLKSASQTLSKIPILNYVVLGKNQEISTNIKVNGSFEEPKFHTQILTDTLKTPFNLIRNIIELPANLFN
ncbi:AsmA-like C-terminal domain-containing protein [Campylobacter sp. MIT 21-1685]|uniref:YhdP family protein n=1 Tax=unclassified Campylobacter TaxID=2593542 RepID=UPI00224B20C3|nr:MULTISPECIES: AsmA-like C-terminal domain-containing protein [unclassified Campylobacter]MCX2682898.1 AsmA-like C-terminal domain-containing protein [Campylobacter sp. MIT 21-1684]MCX2751154.1 AsmA-like C-terminal domain-containing protein [Campylobacter sp. MIT 21-1682]MCX2807379.1 AsmA-like C-terminal domain-containing protein [Campylobacter sp. MIT 21-1685]